MIGIGISGEQRSGGQDAEGAELRPATAVVWGVLAASAGAAVMWLLPVATPEPARNGVGIATVVMLLYPAAKVFRARGLARQAVAAVIAGGIAALVSWALLLILRG